MTMTSNSRMHADSGTFINDHNAVPVTQVHDLLRVWIVTGSEGIRSKPLQQIQVFDDEGVVHTLPTDLEDKQEWG